VERKSEKTKRACSSIRDFRVLITQLNAHHIITCSFGFSDLPTALRVAFDTSKAHTDLIDVLIRLGLFDKLQS
jgi:hypothetical protein